MRRCRFQEETFHRVPQHHLLVGQRIMTRLRHCRNLFSSLVSWRTAFVFAVAVASSKCAVQSWRQHGEQRLSCAGAGAFPKSTKL